MRNFFDIDRFREIYQTLMRNKSRSFLTGFGVFWGIFMMLAMMGGGQGLKALLSTTFQGFATNSGFIASDVTSKPYKGFRSGRSWNLTLDDVESLKRSVPEIDVATGQVSVWGGTVSYGDNSVSAQNVGVYPEYAEIETPLLKYGRYINEVDVRQERKVCVIGKRIYKQLFPEGGDPCGKFVLMGNTYYKIVGVNFSNGNISINGSADRSVVVPMTVLQKLYNKGNDVDVICLTAKTGFKIKDILAEAREIIAREHYIAPDDKKAILDLNAEQMFSIMDNLFKGVNLLVWLVGFGTLLAAAIGVSNIMMVTVKERTTEIGIRRAIGATPRMILGQIMLESVILTMVAGMIGIVFAVGILSVAEIAATASAGMPIGFQISFGEAMLAVLILTVLGLLAGLAPASRAMNIRPVDAMRDE